MQPMDRLYKYGLDKIQPISINPADMASQYWYLVFLKSEMAAISDDPPTIIASNIPGTK